MLCLILAERQSKPVTDWSVILSQVIALSVLLVFWRFTNKYWLIYHVLVCNAFGTPNINVHIRQTLILILQSRWLARLAWSRIDSNFDRLALLNCLSHLFILLHFYWFVAFKLAEDDLNFLHIAALVLFLIHALFIRPRFLPRWNFMIVS